MGSLALLRTLFNYQAWAHEELFDKLESLDRERHGQELHTAIRLINHSYVVAQIFAAHLVGAGHAYASDNTPDTPALQDLHAAVTVSDRWYLDYLDKVDPALLPQPVSFQFTDGDKGSMSREEMLIHVVTHGGYHRGETGRILAQLSIRPPWDTLAVHLHQTEPARRLQMS